jgi:hypothetical protein
MNKLLADYMEYQIACEDGPQPSFEVWRAGLETIMLRDDEQPPNAFCRWSRGNKRAGFVVCIRYWVVEVTVSTGFVNVQYQPMRDGPYWETHNYGFDVVLGMAKAAPYGDRMPIHLQQMTDRYLKGLSAFWAGVCAVMGEHKVMEAASLIV